ncbi:hypothetical protein HQ393_01465 [Chitinibacter bivalviorum]|uniref:LPS-assembly lipoprotein LptE n=1 Tax=Chitinibacter bivalviorum TaxID=2739434 RepID=A0A7H9BHJ8_9NEIS|nr:LPS assembly lipoprotein LptE [Chitinibacter bivalviorum]QLG87014.1 hypothetical protein HQ393_01465 [Chitinibacter bivalviorum]
MPLTFRTLLAAILSLSLMACGFHLRGQGPNAKPLFASAQVIGNGGTGQELSKLLTLLKVNLTSQNPEIKIQIVSETSDKQVLSVNNNGQVAEYRIYYRIRFSAFKAGETLLDDNVLTLQRNLSWDESSVLSKESEEANLIKEMQRDGASQMIRRINSAAKKNQTANTPAASSASGVAAQ